MSISPLSAKRFFADPLGYVSRNGRDPERPLRMRGGLEPQVLIRSREQVWEALVDRADEFEPGKWTRRIARFMGPVLNTLHAAEHRERRAVEQPAFAAPRIADLAPVTAAHVLDWQSEWTDGANFVLRERLDPMVLTAAGRVLLSSDLSAVAPDASRDIRLVIETSPRLTRPLRVTPQGQALARLNDLINRLIEDREARFDPDCAESLIDRMLAAGIERGVIRADVLATLAGVVGEIPDVLEYAFWLLARDPGSDERLARECRGAAERIGDRRIRPTELPFLRAVVNETLRLNPPVRFIDRCPAHGPGEVGGHRLARGSNLLVSPLVAHRDPAVFPKPEQFRPERMMGRDGRAVGHARGEFIPFGLGPHSCIGAPFARSTISITLAVVTERWRLGIDPGTPAPSVNTAGYEVRLEARG
jgi:cytochrome P450